MTLINREERKKNQVEVAHILREHIHEYRSAHTLLPEHHQILSHLLHCRTAKMGGHIERCTHCGAERTTYHSCRDRHCPKCQHIPRERWLQDRKQEILPVPYFHVIFTLPHELNSLILNNKALMCNILFKAVSRTLIQFGRNKLGGKLGFVAVLHTWDQQLKAHFHLHCLVAAGALCEHTSRWIPLKGNYLFNQEALSLVFRGKFIHSLTRSINRGTLPFPGQYQPFRKSLYHHKWVVSVREPIDQPHHVLDYLARYTHRVAIANSRISALKDGMVSFRYKDRKNNTFKHATITAVEFIRRFLLHSLPKGFFRIRHYGFLANRGRKARLAFLFRLLKCHQPLRDATSTLKKIMLKLTGIDISRCPCCTKGIMQLISYIPRYTGKHPHNFIRPPNLPAYLLM